MVGSRCRLSWRCTLPSSSTEEGAVVVLHDLALLGDDGDALLGIAPVVDEDADQQAVGPALADVEGEAPLDRGEAAGLHDVGDEIGAHLGRPVAQLAQAHGRDIGADRATMSDTTTATARNGRNSRNGEKPAAFITMISESVASLLRVCEIAIISAIGAMISTSAGMTRLVMPRKVRMVWPWLVIRSMPRNACVIQITPVRLTSTSRNAPNVVRKMYRPIDPIALRLPRFRPGRVLAPPASGAAALPPRPIPSRLLILSQNGRGKANPLNMHNKRLMVSGLRPAAACGRGPAADATAP